MKTAAVAAVAALLLSACATAPGHVRPTLVSDDAYRGAPCERLNDERTQLDSAYADAARAQNRTRRVDFAGLLLVGLPVSTLTGHSHTREISEIKGKQAAVARAYQAEACSAR